MSTSAVQANQLNAITEQIIGEAHLLSYLKLANCRVGLLLNFHCTMLKHGIRRLVNNFPSSAYSAISAVKCDLGGE
jgi:hypothetical protein